MNIVTDGILVVSSASFTLGLLHFVLCFRRRNRLNYLYFALACFGVGSYALVERAMMLAETPAEYAQLVRWGHITVWFIYVPLVLFVRSYLQTGRTWLLISAITTRSLALILNFASAVNLNFLEVTSIKKVSFLSQIVSIPEGIPNPLTFVAQASHLIVLVYFIDVAIGTWRRGDRQQAATIGVSTIMIAAGSYAMSLLVFWNQVSWPLFVSPFFLTVLASMGYELTRGVHRAAEFAEQLADSEARLIKYAGELSLSKSSVEDALRQSEERFRNVADTAPVLIWMSGMDKLCTYFNKSWLNFTGRTLEQELGNGWTEDVYSEDLTGCLEKYNSAFDKNEQFEMDLRLRRSDGVFRWVHNTGVPRFASDGEFLGYIGSCIDINDRREAKQVLQNFTARLISAQEAERRRVARELHDDLSQNLALLSIKLNSLGKEDQEPEKLKEHIAHLTTQIQKLSSDVHRLSHELHPAKLEQLGLEAALRGFCSEVARTHGLKIDFEAVSVANTFPNDISLCLYRVAQESLQNVVKHSHAKLVSVKLKEDAGKACLTIVDNGRGFDPNVKGSESLGLTSMNERLRAVGGTIAIDSTIGSGTQIVAKVPLVADEGSGNLIGHARAS